jgi:hypothetical protein
MVKNATLMGMFCFSFGIFPLEPSPSPPGHMHSFISAPVQNLENLYDTDPKVPVKKVDVLVVSFPSLSVLCHVTFLLSPYDKVVVVVDFFSLEFI